MFAKPYKQKSNNTLKNTEKKQLIQRVYNEFPAASEERVKELIPIKSNTTCMKLILHSGDIVGVYVVDNVPIMLEVGETLVPTVCALWKVPEMVPVLTIHSLVLPKILGGAPLYAPGVVIPPADSNTSFPTYRNGAVIACNTADNASAGLVGKAAMSSADLLYRGGGVCLDTIHVVGDLLCKDVKFTKIERPQVGPPTYSSSEQLASDVRKLSLQSSKEEWPSLTKEDKPKGEVAEIVINEPKIIPVENENNNPTNDDVECEVGEEQPQSNEIPADMDALLRWCLLSFLKLEGKRIELPLKTNLLYKNHLMPLCPEGRSLDVKKSSYKKMGKFLEAMQQEGLLEVREIDRGVDALVGVNVSHGAVRGHAAPGTMRPTPRAPVESDVSPPQIRDVLCITAAVQQLLGLKKGTPLTSSEVRSILTEYVKSHSLNAQRGAVSLDATLAKILGKPENEQVSWETLISGVSGRMTAGTELRHADGRVTLLRSRLPPVTMTLATRSGNKKVTLVSNLEAYGFNLQRLSHECQVGVAASCGVTRSPGASADQLMLQGDQTYFVAKLLIEKYGLPKKYLEGADKALKKKNK